MKIDKNSFVTIEYLIRLGEQETYPPSGQPEEISFCLGWGAMPPGLEEAMLGLSPEDQRVVSLSPEQAYGEFDQELVMEVPLSDFAPELELRPGLVFETENDEGHTVYFIVQEVRPRRGGHRLQPPPGGQGTGGVLYGAPGAAGLPGGAAGPWRLFLFPMRGRRAPPPLMEGHL